MPPAQNGETERRVGGVEDFTPMEVEFVNQYRRAVDRMSEQTDREQTDQAFAWRLLEERKRRFLQRGIDGIRGTTPEAK